MKFKFWIKENNSHSKGTEIIKSKTIYYQRNSDLLSETNYLLVREKVKKYVSMSNVVWSYFLSLMVKADKIGMVIKMLLHTYLSDVSYAKLRKIRHRVGLWRI